MENFEKIKKKKKRPTRSDEKAQQRRQRDLRSSVSSKKKHIQSSADQEPEIIGGQVRAKRDRFDRIVIPDFVSVFKRTLSRQKLTSGDNQTITGVLYELRHALIPYLWDLTCEELIDLLAFQYGRAQQYAEIRVERHLFAWLFYQFLYRMPCIARSIPVSIIASNGSEFPAYSVSMNGTTITIPYGWIRNFSDNGDGNNELLQQLSRLATSAVSEQPTPVVA